MTSKNIQVFDKINRNFNEAIEKAYQKSATEARNYFLEQYLNSGEDFGGWAPSQATGKYGKYQAGDPVDMHKTGDLEKAIMDIDKTWTRGLKGGLKLKVEVPGGKVGEYSDYAAYQQFEKGRPFFEVSDQLAQKIKLVFQEELNRLK